MQFTSGVCDQLFQYARLSGADPWIFTGYDQGLGGRFVFQPHWRRPDRPRNNPFIFPIIDNPESVSHAVTRGGIAITSQLSAYATLTRPMAGRPGPCRTVVDLVCERPRALPLLFRRPIISQCPVADTERLYNDVRPLRAVTSRRTLQPSEAAILGAAPSMLISYIVYEQDQAKAPMMALVALGYLRIPAFRSNLSRCFVSISMCFLAPSALATAI